MFQDTGVAEEEAVDLVGVGDQAVTTEGAMAAMVGGVEDITATLVAPPHSNGLSGVSN